MAAKRKHENKLQRLAKGLSKAWGGFAHMSDGEKVQFARALAATPDERWEMNVNSLKALGLLGGVRSCREMERRKAKLRRVEKTVLWKTRLSNEELAKGRML